MVGTERGASEDTEFSVVGIGASAGGISALRTLFQAIPAEPNLAFVVVQHLLPDQPSQLASLLGGWTALRVREAANGMQLERNSVFITPPGQALALRGGVFAIEPLNCPGPRPGIDVIDCFFESLADDRGPRAIAVILSGTGSDGAAGAVLVKQAGGVVLVQDPITAMHEGMPSAAVANGAADHIMPLGALAQELVACASPDYARSASAATWVDDVTQALDSIIGLIRKAVGFDLTGYRTPPLLWRIQQRMELRRVPLFNDYAALLRDDPAELETLVRGVPIHITEFFRDREAWNALAHDVIPHLFDEAHGRQIRTWTPACATGEEAYSLAVLLAEHAATLATPADFQVFATDAAPEIVARAGRGMFKPAAVQALSLGQRQRFFYAADGAFRAKRVLREKMVFAPQDLLADPPFVGLDLVTCRNLLIYLEPDASRRVLYLLHSSLAEGGYLFLGKSESLPPVQAGFQVVSPSAHIYRKVGRLPEAAISISKGSWSLRAAQSSTGSVEARAHHAIREGHAFPSVLVDEDLQILRIYEDIGPFLRFRSGQPTLNLLELVSPLLALDIQAAVKQARSELRAVTISGLIDPATGSASLQLRVTPLPREADAAPPLLISFIRSASMSADEHAHAGDRATGSRNWPEALRLSHEELEASREELHALNEELRASNDQLNVANDDLAVANAHLQEKISALEMQSRVLSSGAVMTLFLDEEMRVRWFTSAIEELFPLLPADIGRRISDFAQRFDDDRFIADVRAVMRDDDPLEAEVRTVVGRWFLRRIRTYRSETGAAAGVAVTFTDITDRKKAEMARQETEERFRVLVNASSYAIYRMSPDWTEMRQLDGHGFIADTPTPRRDWLSEYIAPDDQPRVREVIAKAIAGKSVFELEHRVRRPDGTLGWTLSRAVPLFDADGDILEWFGTASEITAAMRLEDQDDQSLAARSVNSLSC